MHQDLGVFGDLVALLADDRDLARFGHEELAQLFELGRGCVAACEDAEVDPDLQAGRLLLDGECDDVLDLHHKSYSRLCRDSTLSWHPAESAQCNSHAEEAPYGQHRYGQWLVPELLAVEVDAVDQDQQVLEREEVTYCAEHPG